jgi:serine/threonine protein kinase
MSYYIQPRHGSFGVQAPAWRSSGQQHPVFDDHSIQWIGKLGDGGSGEVWLGFWPRHGLHVVGKYLRESADSDARRGFAREVRILQRGFPGCVRVFSADAEAAIPYYVMEYIANGPIRKWAGALNRLQLLQIANDASTCITLLHRAGIAHGDVKPDNLLLGDDLRVLVADPIGCGWGCTRLFAENRGGTPGYWAPEIVQNHSIAPAADVWSFGATMHHLQPACNRSMGFRSICAIRFFSWLPRLLRWCVRAAR